MLEAALQNAIQPWQSAPMIARPTANLFALSPTPARQIRSIAQQEMATHLQPDAPALKQ